MADNSILELRGVNLAVGNTYLLQEITFSLARGERLAIVGASGAGKTTLLRLLNRLEEPTMGTIFFEGKPIQQMPIIQLRQQIALVPQEPKLLNMTVQEALSYPLQLQKRSKREIIDRIGAWTSLLRIPEQWFDRTELELSLGQRQLVAIARSLTLQPKILLLDEPTSALDVGMAMRLLEVLESQSEITIIMINHQLELAKIFAQKVIYLQSGKVLEINATNPLDWDALRERLIESERQKMNEDWED